MIVAWVVGHGSRRDSRRASRVPCAVRTASAPHLSAYIGLVADPYPASSAIPATRRPADRSGDVSQNRLTILFRHDPRHPGRDRRERAPERRVDRRDPGWFYALFTGR
jgi:hypothetical protein